MYCRWKLYWSIGIDSKKGNKSLFLFLIFNNLFKEVDRTTIPDVIETDQKYFTFTKVVLQKDYIIVSERPVSKIINLNLIDTFKVFDIYTFISFVMLFLVLYIIVRKFMSIRFIDDTVGSIIGQNYDYDVDENRGIRRKFLFTWIFLSFFLVKLFLASFTTDLVEVIPSKPIDSIEDLAESNYNISFHPLQSAHNLFINSSNEKYRKVWEKCGNSFEKCKFKSMNLDKDKLRAIISPDNFYLIFKKLFCRKDISSKTKSFYKNKIFHQSKKFSSQLTAYITSKNLDPSYKEYHEFL
ncbi:MAG: hypothetical protein QM535_22245 [Limnohabitans sp.]|nr:hypothetical protein [Limnohabitans sp.]